MVSAMVTPDRCQPPRPFVPLAATRQAAPGNTEVPAAAPRPPPMVCGAVTPSDHAGLSPFP